MVTVAYHADINEAQDDAEIAALLRGSSRSAPFDRAELFDLLARHDAGPAVLVVARSGQHRAMLALSGCGHLRSAVNWYAFRARPLITEGGNGHAMLAAMARSLTARAWRVTLAPLPDEDGSATLAQAAFAAAGWRVERKECDVNHVLQVAGRSYAQYLQTRPGPLRSTLKRKAGKVEIELLTHFEPSAWAQYESVYAASWKPEEGSPEFLRDFARQEGAAGRLRMAIARVDGRAIAAQFWTVEGGTAFIHKLAHIESAAPLSPGTTLSAALFERVIDHDKVDLVDFGTGDDPFKRDWMEHIRPRFRVDCLNPGSPRAWPHIARNVLRHLAPTARAN